MARQPHALFLVATLLVLCATSARADQYATMKPADIDARSAAIAALHNPGASDFAKVSACESLARLGVNASVAVPELVQHLAERGEVRHAAERALRAIGAPAVPSLLNAINDDNAERRIEAADLLGSLGANASSAVRSLQEMLRAPDPSLRMRACRALKGLGPLAKEAGPELYIVLRDSDYMVRRSALEAIQAIEPHSNSTLLWAIVESHTKIPSRQIHAARFLQRLGPAAKPAVPDLVDLLASPEAEVRSAAMATLADLQPLDRRGVAALAALLRPQRGTPLDSPRVIQTQALALQLLAGDGTKARDAIPAVVQLLAYPVEQTRLAAAQTLAKLGQPDEQGVAAMRPLLDPTVRPRLTSLAVLQARQAIIRSLRSAGPGAAPALPELLAQLPDPQLGDSCADAIVHVGSASQDAIPTLAKMIQEPQPVGDRALNALATLAGDQEIARSIVNELTDALKSNDIPTRCRAAEGLGRMGDAARPAIPALAAMLQSKDDAEVAGAARGLAHFGPAASAVVPTLARVLDSRMADAGAGSESQVAARAACADALARIAPDSKETAEILLKAVRHKDWVIREHLAPAFSTAKIKPGDLVPDLAALAARSQDELVRINARCALREIGAEVALK